MNPFVLVPLVPWEPSLNVFSGLQNFYGLCARSKWWVKKERASYLLFEYEIRRLWIPLFHFRKDFLCFGVGNIEIVPLNAIPYHTINFPNGSIEIPVWKNLLLGRLTR